MSYSPWIGNLTVDGTLGNYGTVKRLLDESNVPPEPRGLHIRVEIAGQGMASGDFDVEVFTNLNRRDFAVVSEQPQDAGTANSYWVAFALQPAGKAFDNLVYETRLPVLKCGAYRLTARYRLKGRAGWFWHNDFSPFDGAPRHRDCAIVISPAKAARATIYEANALTVEATQGGDFENRSTFEDFLSISDIDDFNPFQVGYVRSALGFNTLWLMPIFPQTAWCWDRPNWRWGPNNSPGSPYATRDYWSVNPWLAADRTADRAMQLLNAVMEEAEASGLDVYFDVALNHAGRDVVFGEGAVQLGLCAPADASTWVRVARPQWCTRGVDFHNGYAIPFYREAANNDFECAVWAPGDRLNEHVWDDANVDWFFGSYSALGPKSFHGASDYWGNPVRHSDALGSAEDERDLFYTDLSQAPDVAALWTYFAHLFEYWLDKTAGRLAGIRADFAQGLPNQLWELIINKTRQARWDFVFLAEVLDPDQIQYRLNKVFDVLTTKDHWLYRRAELTTPELVGSLEAEARLFSSDGLVMHNGTSHDEEGNADRWMMTARYGVSAALGGVPMIFMGQPLGQQEKLTFRESWANLYERWSAPAADRDAVAAMYRRINRARESSPELTGSQRYFLATMDGGMHARIFAVARWVSTGERDSLVIAFVNLDSASAAAATFRIPVVVRLAGDYQAVNLVANDPLAHLWPTPRRAEDIYTEGMHVRFSLPNEVQYVRLISA